MHLHTLARTGACARMHVRMARRVRICCTSRDAWSFVPSSSTVPSTRASPGRAQGTRHICACISVSLLRAVGGSGIMKYNGARTHACAHGTEDCPVWLGLSRLCLAGQPPNPIAPMPHPLSVNTQEREWRCWLSLPSRAQKGGGSRTNCLYDQMNIVAAARKVISRVRGNGMSRLWPQCTTHYNDRRPEKNF